MDYFESFGIEVGNGKYHEEAVYGIALVYAALYNNISAYLNKYGLTPAKMNVLMITKHQGQAKGISQVDIGKRLMVTASNMTRLLDKLEREGLINRSALAGDRRVKIIKVTPKASKLLDMMWPGYQTRLKALANEMPKEDQKVMAGLLQKWLGRLVKA